MKYTNSALLTALLLTFAVANPTTLSSSPAFIVLRGGQTIDVTSSSTTVVAEESPTKNTAGVEMSLEDKVQAAMRKLGISTEAGSNIHDAATPNNVECQDGVCNIIQEEDGTVINTPENFNDIKNRLLTDFSISESIVQAAIGATIVGDAMFPAKQRLNERAARELLQYEVDAMKKVMADCDEVKQLTSEGFDQVLVRRALAFADMDVMTARAILQADEEDAKQEELEMARIKAENEEQEKRNQLRAEAEAKKKREMEMKTVSVDAKFDPTNVEMNQKPSLPKGVPKPAKKEDVVFEATSANIQKRVLESPVPVLLDVYADWCGPCKALAPILEEMAIKGGGMFRVVKLNTDNERTISSALEVTSLPTIFGIRNGKIVNSFKGMPRDQKFMTDFMMGLFGAADFKPKPTGAELAKYDDLTNKLIKIAGASGFSFSQRERLQVRTNNMLDELVQVRGDMSSAEETAKVLRSLLSNVIRDPFDQKYRQINLDNKVIQARVTLYAPALSILKSVGFEDSEAGTLILGRGKNVINVAPLVVARDTIDKWIDLNRRAIAAAARKKEDDIARMKILEGADELEEEEEEKEDEQVDPNVCHINLRVQGKKKIHQLSLNADDSLWSILDNAPVSIPEDEEVIITCTARRLIVKRSEDKMMSRSLRDCKLHPSATLVLQIGSEIKDSPSSSLQERAAARRSRKKGEHTMQSIGIYSKDDNAKGELIDGGGGVWYEQDVTSDDDKEINPNNNENSVDDPINDTDESQ